MTKVRYVVVPLTMVAPMPKSAEAFADGWSQHVAIDAEALRNMEGRIRTIEAQNEHLQEAGANDRLITTRIIVGCIPYETELVWAKDGFEVDLHKYRGYAGDSELWSHPVARSLTREDIYEIVDGASEYPEWSLVNRHTVRCGGIVVTSLTPDATYKDVDYKIYRTLWHQMDQMRGLGWVPAGLNAFIKHEGGLPKPSDKLKHVLASARLEGREDWEMYKVLQRLYEKLGGK